jgi:hypothetical protein
MADLCPLEACCNEMAVESQFTFRPTMINSFYAFPHWKLVMRFVVMAVSLPLLADCKFGIQLLIILTVVGDLLLLFIQQQD